MFRKPLSYFALLLLLFAAAVLEIPLLAGRSMPRMALTLDLTSSPETWRTWMCTGPSEPNAAWPLD